MSLKERIRLEALARVKRGEVTVMEAAGLMGLSLRQARRMWKRYKADGDVGLVHRLRGRASNHRLPADVRDRVIKRHQERYADFGPTLACEKLASDDDLVLSPDTLTALLKERGLWRRRRRRGRHRKRRERRACLGSLVQMDGSHHDWFEGRAPWCVLMVLIDDATNRTYARFYAAETTEAAFDALGRWVQRQRGVPRGLYVDRHAIYRDEDHPDRPTQFGRAMRELGVQLIQAHSPQAKGRVERRNAVFQDRLVKELRLRGIDSMQQANPLLEGTFLDDLNRRYAVKPTRDQDLHRALDASVVLADVLCVREARVVGRDWCVRWQNRWLQIDGRQHAALNLAGRTVQVRHRADGQVLIDYKSQRLTFEELRARPAPAKVKRAIVNNRKWKPSATHPWNKAAAAPPATTTAAGSSSRSPSPRPPPAEPAPAAPARVPLAAGKRKAG